MICAQTQNLPGCAKVSRLSPKGSGGIGFKLTQTTGHSGRTAATVGQQSGVKGRYRTFSVASPIIARISEMIQNRITICGSAQPFFS